MMAGKTKARISEIDAAGPERFTIASALCSAGPAFRRHDDTTEPPPVRVPERPPRGRPPLLRRARKRRGAGRVAAGGRARPGALGKSGRHAVWLPGPVLGGAGGGGVSRGGLVRRG